MYIVLIISTYTAIEVLQVELRRCSVCIQCRHLRIDLNAGCIGIHGRPVVLFIKEIVALFFQPSRIPFFRT